MASQPELTKELPRGKNSASLPQPCCSLYGEKGFAAEPPSLPEGSVDLCHL